MLRTTLWLVVRIIARLPWSALRRPGAVLGFLAGSVLRIRRRQVVAAMARAGVPDVASAMYRGLGISLCELFWLAGKSPAARAKALEERFTMDAAFTAALADAHARGPVILAASHTANWELVAFGAARAFERQLGARTCVVVKDLSVGVFHAFCTRLREECGVTLLPPAGALESARKHLAAGDIVAMAIDQVPALERHGVRVPFLGALALADRAPAALAKLTNATILVIGATRRGDGQHLELLAALTPTSVEETTRACQRALDAFVRRHPSSWLWLHRRWRDSLPMRRSPGKHNEWSVASR